MQRPLSVITCTHNPNAGCLTPARLRGIRESKGDLLVFVDDDKRIEQLKRQFEARHFCFAQATTSSTQGTVEMEILNWDHSSPSCRDQDSTRTDHRRLIACR
jgi:hypothetical protein